MVSMDEAIIKLTECKVLLKYMSFLQNNGFSDCGKGQIIGKAALLEEYVKKEEHEQNEQNHTVFESYNKEKEQENHRINISNSEGMIAETFRKNASTYNPGLLREAGIITEKSKDKR
jgi:hypothetical protein